MPAVVFAPSYDCRVAIGGGTDAGRMMKSVLRFGRWRRTGLSRIRRRYGGVGRGGRLACFGRVGRIGGSDDGRVVAGVDGADARRCPRAESASSVAIISRASVTPPEAAAPAPVTVTRQSVPPVNQPYSTARASANWTLEARAVSEAGSFEERVERRLRRVGAVCTARVPEAAGRLGLFGPDAGRGEVVRVVRVFRMGPRDL